MSSTQESVIYTIDFSGKNWRWSQDDSGMMIHLYVPTKEISGMPKLSSSVSLSLFIEVPAIEPKREVTPSLLSELYKKFLDDKSFTHKYADGFSQFLDRELFRNAP